MIAEEDDSDRTLPDGLLPSGNRSLLEHFGAGRLVDDKFRLRRRIGVGGMAQVVLAHDVALDREVALKFLAPHLLANATWRAQFISEARSMARVRHENVVQVYSFGIHAGWPYFAMEFVAGTTLAIWLRDHPDRTVEQSMAIVRQIARGLTAIHEAGLVHHDVKPANVLVRPDGTALLTDLGLARLGASTKKNLVAGTPAYMAPEQLGRKPLPPELANRTDVYQLGLVTFEILTGIRPFRDDDEQKVLTRQCMAQPPRPSDVRPELGEAFDAAIADALEKDPARRPASARAFLEALERACPPARKRALRVLVADDEPLLLQAAVAVLRQSLPPGSAVEAVADGTAALAACESGSFDVALLDLQMPGMSGLEVAAALCGKPDPRPRVVVATAVGGAADWRVLHDIGVDAFLLKPIDADDLVAAVERAAAR